MSNNEHKLRIGLLFDSFMIPAWMYYLIEYLKNSNFVTIDLIILNKTKLKKENFFSRFIKNRDYHLYTFFMKFEKLFFHTEFDPLVLENSKKLLENINILEVFPEQTKYSDRFNKNDTNKIAFSEKETKNGLSKKSFVESFLSSLKQKMYGNRK